MRSRPLIPHGPYILVKRIKPKERKIEGIIIPSNESENDLRRAEVLRVSKHEDLHDLKCEFDARDVLEPGEIRMTVLYAGDGPDLDDGTTLLHVGSILAYE